MRFASWKLTPRYESTAARLVPDRHSLVLFDTKPNRHSLNALVGALETARDLDALELRLAANESELGRQIGEAIAGGRRPIVGLSCTTQQLWGVAGLIRRLRAGGVSAQDGPLWIAGGPHPTADPEGTLRLGFDAVVCGEGEMALLDLLRAVVCGGELGDVPGVVVPWRKLPACDSSGKGKLEAYPTREPVDLDAFPPFPLTRRRVVGPIEITRGCPFNCGYCQTSNLLGFRPRHRGIEAVARFAGVIRQRGLRDVRLLTPNAFSYGSPDGRTLNLPAVESLLRTLRETLGPDGRFYFGSFPAEVRPEHVNPTTVGLVTRFANNDNLVIGAQSGSPRMLERCGRGHDVAQVLAAVAHTRAAGLRAQVDFIFGLPGETSRLPAGNPGSQHENTAY